MTRGTIIVVGEKRREWELFTARLAKERFTVEVVPPRTMAKRIVPRETQAVFITPLCPLSVATAVKKQLQRYQPLRPAPFIALVAEDSDQYNPIFDDVYNVHAASLASLMQRFLLGLELVQLTRTYAPHR